MNVGATNRQSCPPVGLFAEGVRHPAGMGPCSDAFDAYLAALNEIVGTLPVRQQREPVLVAGAKRREPLASIPGRRYGACDRRAS